MKNALVAINYQWKLINYIMRKPKKLVIMLAAVIFFLLSFSISHAEVEWSLGKEYISNIAALDVASSFDGQWIFVLSAGEISVYSTTEDKPINLIPVDKSFDRISCSGQGNILFLSSSTGKTIKTIYLEQVNRFSLDSLAAKGEEKAPVAIAVFSDYQ